MRQHNKHTLIPFLMVGVALAGLLDATYLSVSELKGTSLLCGGLGDCTGVTSSEYSRILGVPVAYLGFFYYAVFFFVSLTIATFSTRTLLFPLFLFSAVGVGASVWFVFAQVVLLESICIYCMISALTSTALFLLTLRAWNNQKGILSSDTIDSTELEQV